MHAPQPYMHPCNACPLPHTPCHAHATPATHAILSTPCPHACLPHTPATHTPLPTHTSCLPHMPPTQSPAKHPATTTKVGVALTTGATPPTTTQGRSSHAYNASPYHAHLSGASYITARPSPVDRQTPVKT